MNENSLNEIDFTETDVFHAFTNLNSSKSTGIDTISPCVLKDCACALVAPLFHLFTTSLSTSIIPTEWKTHDYSSSVKNYCTISLLCNVPKVLEHLIYDKLYSVVSKHISPCQFGFQRNTSTFQQLL